MYSRNCQALDGIAIISSSAPLPRSQRFPTRPHRNWPERGGRGGGGRVGGGGEQRDGQGEEIFSSDEPS